MTDFMSLLNHLYAKYSPTGCFDAIKLTLSIIPNADRERSRQPSYHSGKREKKYMKVLTVSSKIKHIDF